MTTPMAAPGAVFASFKLNPALQQAINDSGYTTPTPIQAQTIPAIMAGKDVFACAPTGTGKTAAFVLPALHQILSGPSGKRGHGPRVLVLTPTRELADQIVASIQQFSKHARVRSGLVIGGVGYGQQLKLLSQPLDLLVATPGRLIDHLQERRVDFGRVELLVLDEADRMLDMGFLKPVERIMAALNGKVQTLLFSATFEPAVAAVAKKVLQDPLHVQLTQARQTHTAITQKAYFADNTEHKQNLLNKLLRTPDVAQAIVFTATKRNADKLAEKLETLGFAAGALHGDMKQNARKRTLAGLHSGKLQVLVATDVAARGLDVKNLSHVFNYDLPNLPEDFTHRIGRTGRGGAVGIAVSLVSPPDLPVLRDVEKMLGKPLVFSTLAGLEPTLPEADFRRLVPTEPPPGRPVKQGRGGGGRGRPGQGRPGGKPMDGQRSHGPSGARGAPQGARGGRDARDGGRRSFR